MKMSALYVEDSEVQAELITRLLTCAEECFLGGLQFTVLGTLAEAKSALTPGRFDVLLLDLSLPDSSAEATTKWLAESNKATLPPIIVVTNDIAPETSTSVVALGAENCIDKPMLTLAPALAMKMIWQAILRRKRDQSC